MLLPHTTRNTVIGCALSEVVYHEPQLKHYQQRFISSLPFQLLGAGLSVIVQYYEPLLIIELLAAVQKYELQLVIGCTINNGLLWNRF
jgi:hypothetical protein